MPKRLFDYQNGDDMKLPVLIKSADVRVAKNGKKFIAFVFQDKSGHITGMLWDASADAIAQFKPGMVVQLNAKREVYHDSPQVKIYNVRLATQEEGADPKAFMERAPEAASTMEEEIGTFLFDILNPNWNRIVRRILNEHHDQFFNYPAAKSNHHATAGGLAFHTLSILRLAKHIGEQYPGINVSLLYSGAILHDMGKTIELSGAASTEYTIEGNLIGHIVLIDEEIVKACDALGINPQDEDVMMLRHTVLAHHGLLEYGSPVRPALLEAEVLHDLDELDASINMMTNALAHTQNGEFSERLFGMDNRRFYKPASLQHYTKK
ncbi:3'-5' exoribonuclease YhaM family protein [Lacticaseibacillus sharpeae]|uniref:HD-superfamily hydrolase n=1 Tax=Lacticaseibacillus sharpeae JCM 1186 = DSM 20505 TaxID=1291052 RepID=A0A0R1ZN93_9LACO|nr:HD domain-containing protein [Lacticaseibacillus sharpeae]KRM56584.1 HD-superfamily hydrolase [Lacticaseibacillus sharpeae JCM 1186 = DSM 20505]